MRLLPDDGNNISVERGLDAVPPIETYRMHIDAERVDGALTDEITAVKQAVYKILNTERYKHIIYSWDYGVELADLFGKPMPYVLPEIPRRIREALIVDDRITDVDRFELDAKKNGDVTARFVVHTIYGAFDAEKAVKIQDVRSTDGRGR